MKFVICAIVRTENRYLPSWIDYHLSLGFNHIFLYDNAMEGEEHVEEALTTQTQKESVTVIHYYDKRGAQVAAYTDFYKNYSRDFDYVAYIDVDEFISFEKDSTNNSKFTNIKDFIRFLGTPEAISLNWMTFGDNGIIKDDGRPDYERFITPLPHSFSKDNLWGKQSFNCHVKTIYKTGLPIGTIMPHCSNGDYNLVNACGDLIQQVPIQPLYTFSNCYIKHFITRTISEYIETKVKRGCRVDGQPGVYPIADFFYYNKPTFRKLRIYRQTLSMYPGQPKRPLKWWMKCLVKMWVINPLYLNRLQCFEPKISY